MGTHNDCAHVLPTLLLFAIRVSSFWLRRMGSQGTNTERPVVRRAAISR